MKRKAMIYPYDRETYPLICNMNQVNDEFEIVHIVSLKGYSGKNNDAGEVLFLPKCGIEIENDYEECLKDVEVVIIVSNNSKSSHIIEKNILIALNCGKKVICYRIVEKEILENLREYMNSGQFIYKPDEFKKRELEDVDISNLIYESMDVPVIFIGEVYSQTESYEALVKLHNDFQKLGYKVTAIGNELYSELLHIHTIPQYLGSGQFTVEEQIYAMNHYVKKLEKEEKPDIIFIQLPGGIAKYNNRITSGFGVVPFIIGQAVRADYMILCVSYGKMKNQYIELMKEICKYKFGVELFAMNMSNRLLISDMTHKSQLTYIYVEQEKLNKLVEEKYGDTEIPIYSIYNEQANNQLINYLIDLLSEKE